VLLFFLINRRLIPSGFFLLYEVKNISDITFFSYFNKLEEYKQSFQEDLDPSVLMWSLLLWL
jgi:hypothetical protein